MIRVKKHGPDRYCECLHYRLQCRSRSCCGHDFAATFVLCSPGPPLHIVFQEVAWGHCLGVQTSSLSLALENRETLWSSPQFPSALQKKKHKLEFLPIQNLLVGTFSRSSGSKLQLQTQHAQSHFLRATVHRWRCAFCSGLSRASGCGQTVDKAQPIVSSHPLR